MKRGSEDLGAEAINPRKRLPSWFALLCSLALGALTGWLLMGIHAANREAAFMAGIFVLAAMLWVTEALPLFATSLLVIGLQAVLLANPGGWPGLGFQSGRSPSYREILSTAADPVLVLFFGGFVLAQAAVKVGMDRAMSALLLRPFGGKPRWVLLGLMLITLLFGMWMSNTATATMMLAVVTPMLTALPPKEPFRKALVLCIPFSANIGGMSTPVASPPNAVASVSWRTPDITSPFWIGCWSPRRWRSGWCCSLGSCCGDSFLQSLPHCGLPVLAKNFLVVRG